MQNNHIRPYPIKNNYNDLLLSDDSQVSKRVQFEENNHKGNQKIPANQFNVS